MEDNMVMERGFQVDKTQCEGCEATIEKQLLAVPGVLEAKADDKTGKVWVRYDPAQVRFDALPPIVEAVGFPRIFEFSDEHHQDFLWGQKEEVVVRKAMQQKKGV